MVLEKNGQLKLVVSGIKNPFGLALDENNNNLFVASNTAGEIYKVSNGKKALFAKIPGGVSYIDYSIKTKCLYITCFTCHNIYKISKEGKLTLLSGKGTAGYKDGVWSEAEFDGPNSIVLSESGNLFISEFKSNRIRKINKVE